MLIALTGLHAAGKSYFANTIPGKYGFEVYNKKEIIKKICKKETNREDYIKWYQEEFNKNPKNITEKILLHIDTKKRIILDAVHSDLEWNIILSIMPTAELLGIITPNYIRKQRMEEGDCEKNKQRIKYWHNGGGCLMTNLSWTINGGASSEINEKSFQELIQYMLKREEENQIQNNETIEEKIRKLQSLIDENNELDEKMKVAEHLIREYNKKIAYAKNMEKEIER